MSDDGHSKWLAPSSIGRRILCPGSAYLEAEMPRKSNQLADRGTVCHLLAEAMVVHGIDPASRIGDELLPGITVDADMASAATVAGTAALEIIDSAGDSATVATEMRLPELFGCFGTSDLLIDELFGALWVADYKFGQVDVPADCPQLRTYAVLAAGCNLATYQAIKLVIIQPATKRVPEVCELLPSDLAEWRDSVLLPTIEAVNSGTARRSASPDACQYCKATGICQEYNQAALEAAQADFRGVVQSPALTDELVCAVYPQIPLLEGWIATVKQRARELAEFGNLPGYKMVSGRSSRTWRDEQKAADTIAALGHEPYERKLITPAKAEKLSKEVKEAINDMIAKTAGNPAVVPEDNPKTAIPPRTTAREDFATETTHAS